MEYFHRIAVVWLSIGGLRARAGLAMLATIIAVGSLAAVPAAAQRYERGLLWRIEGGAAQASHVFGTIHLADKRVAQLPPAVSSALQEARSLSIEVGFDPASLVALAGRMIFQDERDLPGVAGPELYQKAVTLTARLGLPEPALRRFRPWAIALLLSAPPQDPAGVLDVVLAGAARAQGKPVHELESMEEQVAVFEGLPDADQVVLLRQAVEGYERLPGTISRVIEAYLAGDLAGMSRISDEMPGADANAKRLHAVVNRRLLDERNVRMAERLQARLKEGGALVAIGALHLYGEKGVLAELAKRGWRVTRVY